MDVEAYYPNMDIDVVADEAKAEVMESAITVDGIDMTEVALFLACTMTQTEIDNEELGRVVHRRKKNRGANLDYPAKQLLVGAWPGIKTNIGTCLKGNRG